MGRSANPYLGSPWKPRRGTEKLHALREELLVLQLSNHWDPQEAWESLEAVRKNLQEDGELGWERWEIEHAHGKIYYSPGDYVRFCFFILGWVPHPEVDND